MLWAQVQDEHPLLSEGALPCASQARLQLCQPGLGQAFSNMPVVWETGGPDLATGHLPGV